MTLTKNELKGFKNPKNLFLAAVGSVITYYVIKSILVTIGSDIDNQLMFELAISGIVGYIIGDVID